MTAKPGRPAEPKSPGNRPFNRDTTSRGPVSRKKSQRGTRLPHERDELAESKPRTADEDIVQAHKDLESGQVDTDLRGTATGVFKRSGSTTSPGKRKPGGS